MLIALRLAEIVVSLVVVGEAAALGVGAGLLGGQATAWATQGNLILLLSDVALGVGLIYCAVSSNERSPAVPALATALVITHLYRAVEYFLEVQEPFCGNVWLFLVNDLKLVGAAAILVIWIRARRP